MRIVQFLGFLFGLLSLSLAIFDDEAFVVDWEIKQIGQIQEQNVLSPEKETVYVFTNRNVLTAVSKGIAIWRVSFDDARTDANNRILHYDDNKILTGINYVGRSVIKVWDSQRGFMIKNLHVFRDELIDLASLKNGSIAAVFINGDIIVMNSNGEIVFEGNIPDAEYLKIAVLTNHFYVLYNKPESKNVFINIFDGETLHEIPFSVPYDSIVDVYGSKIVYKTNKYYLVNVNPKTLQLSSPKVLPASAKYIPLETDEYIALEKDHNIEVFTSDVEPHFTIKNVYKYALKFSSSSFVLYTEFHANILDADTGAELKSHLFEERIDHDNILAIFASTDDVEEIESIVQFQNNTYAFFINEEKSWSRDISLSNITAHAVVDLPYEDTITDEEIIYEEGLDIFNAYFYRVKRHLKELKDLYNYLWLLLELWATEQLPDSTTWKNKYFGFEKLLVAGTENGRLIALNTLDGSIQWSIDAGSSPIIGIENVHNSELYVYTASEVRYIVNATTGELIHRHAIATPHSVKRLSENDDFMIEIDDGFDILLTSEPQNFDETYFVKRTKSYIQGHVIKDTKTQTTWKFSVSKNEEIIGYATKDSSEEVANVGIILGDRSVLYKYLYPNLAAFGVFNKSTKALYIHIIDTITGEILHSVIHDEFVHENERFDIVFGEHWVVYSYWSNLPVPDQKIVVIDLYESLIPNTRFSSSAQNQSSFDFAYPPAVISKSFILPYKITSLGLSKTRFGVTTKSILVSLTNGQILSIPKHILNARRVAGRPMSDTEKLEPFLLPYDPVILLDASNVITHKRDILGVKTLISIPTSLESTTIICGYGLDVFCTRISPSLQFDKLTQSFDYIKLIGSLVLLIAIYLIVRYLNNKRKLKNAWVYTD